MEQSYMRDVALAAQAPAAAVRGDMAMRPSAMPQSKPTTEPLGMLVSQLEAQVDGMGAACNALHDPINHLFGGAGDPRVPTLASSAPTSAPSSVADRLNELSIRLGAACRLAAAAVDRLHGGL